MAAFMFLAERRRDRDHHATLLLQLLAQNGDEQAVKSQLRVWEDGE